MSQSHRLPLNKCESCGFDLRLSRFAHCCDKVFDADGVDAKVKCPRCKTLVEPIPDEPMMLCKYCMRKIEEMSNDDKDKKEMLKPRCNTDGGTRSKSRCPAETSDTSPKELASSAIAPDNLKDLWRYLGCVCGNQEPESFELQQIKWPKKSYYCQDCKQPYSSFFQNNELRDNQCPRCNGAKIITDKMTEGDTMIVCLNCSSMVSKRRYDEVCQEVLEQERQSSKLQIDGCLHCGNPLIEMGLANCDGNPCVIQICSRCDSENLIAAWDRTTDRIGVPEASEPLGNSIEGTSLPEGFEELIECCGDLGLMHPVEDDPKDELLMCSRCCGVISLMNCRDKRIPPCVSSLRRALEGKFSSGRMGKPYNTVKVSSLDELKPGDQLDFKRSLYSHHAIVEEPVPEKDEVKVIEYTGESNRMLAFLRILPSKACVQKKALKFKEQMKYMYRVDYHSLDCYHPQAVVARAKKRVGEEKYNLIASNCEHFSNWAKANINFSRQVEALKKPARSALRLAVMDITELIDDLPQNRSARAAVTILEDIRADMLRVLDTNSPSIEDFWCPIRLLLKWAIHGIPVALSKVFPNKTMGCKLIQNLDGIFRPLSDKVANSLTPKTEAIEDGEKQTKEK